MANYFFVLGREKCSVFNGLRASRPVVQVFFYLAIEKKFFIGVIKEKSWTVGREMVKNGNFYLKLTDAEITGPVMREEEI